MTPLCFANPSPPSGWIGDFHPQAIEHAGHTTKTALAVICGQRRVPRNGGWRGAALQQYNHLVATPCHYQWRDRSDRGDAESGDRRDAGGDGELIGAPLG